mmetsp:Transcript_1408/g.1612  ORF Transcript_1408/g.1612 Transcript_1408/m.1612 type:complete len:139 (-) Transcript_1408:376-792(-)
MEMYSTPLVTLLSKFSHAHVILAYYGDVFNAQFTMNALSLPTRTCWRSNYKAFCNALEYMRRPLEYTLDFDEEIAEYLLHNAKYNLHVLRIKLFTSQGVDTLIDSFVDKLNDCHNLQFEHVLVNSFMDNFVAQFNKLY